MTSTCRYVDGHPDLVLINRNSGRVGPTDSFIYWSNAAHDHSPASMTALAGTENTVATAADLDQNGWGDLVFPERPDLLEWPARIQRRAAAGPWRREEQRRDRGEPQP